MIFTGLNLERIREGITLAIAELRNQIATCPDIHAYGRELEELDDEVECYEQLLTRIDRGLEKEKRASGITWVTLCPNQYIGKVCDKHPELNGLRARPSYRYVECYKAYQREAARKRYQANKIARGEE